MAYLSEPTSKNNYGVVQIGDYIDVTTEGIVSLPQDIGFSANVTHNALEATSALTLDGESVITTISPSASDGIELTNIVYTGPHAEFTIKNTGVLSLAAGSGITLDASTGHITISSYGADLINVVGTSTNYDVQDNDEYIGVSSASAVTITLPQGIPGRVYTIKDEYGQGSGKIKIQPQQNEKIDKATSYIISTPYQSVSIVFRAGGWWII